MGLPPVSNPEIEDQLLLVQDLWRSFSKDIDKGLSSKSDVVLKN